MSANISGICHKSSSTTVGCSFAECQISSIQWDELRGTDQRAGFTTWCTGNEYTWHLWAPHHQQVYMHGATWMFLASGHCFQAGAFSGSHHMSLDHLFSLCVDLKAGMSRDQFEPFRPNLVDLVHVWTIIPELVGSNGPVLVETSHANSNWTSNDLSYFTLTSVGRNVTCVFWLDQFW